ncbi:MAG TPA: BON domain-containing protein, partial [Terriglobales bacterium]
LIPRSQISRIFALVVFGLSLVACSSGAPQPAASASAAAPKNDYQIRTDVEKKIAADEKLKGRKIDVQSNGGVVILTGTVADVKEFGAAQVNAAGVSGVKMVINRLKVENPDEPAGVPETKPQ